MNKTVLISGISGFLGSHIAEQYCSYGYKVIGLKRSASDLWRCNNFLTHVKLINIEEEVWKRDVIASKPLIIIHAAWNAVSSKQRNNFAEQIKNIDFLLELLELSKQCGVKQFVGLGSQAEYGYMKTAVWEEKEIKPDSAYGIVKVLASTLTEHYCNLHAISWYWLRLFSFYGEREDENWLIPSVIQKILKGEKKLYFSNCTQKYSYMYVKDMADAIIKLTEKKPGSGIYNISSMEAQSLQYVIRQIVEMMGKSNEVELCFGELPMRKNQSIVIQGKMDKYINNIEILKESDFTENIKSVIEYYSHQNKKVI